MNTQIYNVDNRIYTKVIKHNKEFVNVTLRTIPVLEILLNLYSKPNNTITFIKSSNYLGINYFDIMENKKNLAHITLLIKYTFKPLFFTCLEYFMYKNINSLTGCINFASFFSPLRLNIFINLHNKNILPTLSSLFFNVLWLEREILDFSNLSIYKLKDTRRLMLDYLQTRQYPNQTLVYDYTYNHFINELYTIKW